MCIVDRHGMCVLAVHVEGGLQHFVVALDKVAKHPNTPYDEVASRIREFFGSLKKEFDSEYCFDGDKTVSVCSTSPSCAWLIDFELRLSERCEASNDESTKSDVMTVCLSCFSDSSMGIEIIRTIQRAIQADVCRTNRKWRRQLSAGVLSKDASCSSGGITL